MSANVPAVIYARCPHCNVPLTRDWFRSGAIDCPYCSRPFLAAAFNPPTRKARPTAVVESFPEGANACANHPGNAALTSCSRCGLFICSLCDMNLGEGSYCPSCFDRVRNEGELRGAATRYRDYASMATVTALIGILFSMMFLGIPVGGLALFYARKGLEQRRQEGMSTIGMRFVAILALLEVSGGLAMIGFFVWAVVKGASS